MTILHRPGKKHGNADALSRSPGEKPCQQMMVMIDPAQLSCGGCSYCTRSHTDWSKFSEDVVPLCKKMEITEAHAALSWWFNNDKNSHDQELQSAMFFKSLEISFANPDISFISTCHMDVQHCNQFCTATRPIGFASIAYSPEQLKELQKKIPIFN